AGTTDATVGKLGVARLCAHEGETHAGSAGEENRNRSHYSESTQAEPAPKASVLVRAVSTSERGSAAELLRHLLAELCGSVGGRLDRVDQRAAEPARFERVEAGDRRPAGARHHVLQSPGVLAGLELELRRPVNGLGGKKKRGVAPEADLHAAVRERLD